MVVYRAGDLFEFTEDVLAHGCNTSGGFGAGVAAGVARRWPQVRLAYLRAIADGRLQLGDVQLVHIDGRPLGRTGVVVANMMTQERYGGPGRRLDYGALERAITRLVAWSAQRNCSVAMPRVGCGLGGGDWERVKAILERAVADRPIRLVVYLAGQN